MGFPQIPELYVQPICKTLLKDNSQKKKKENHDSHTDIKLTSAKDLIFLKMKELLSELKFMCLAHIEVKQTKKLVSGAEKGLLQSPSKVNGLGVF